ncbi:MAG: EAL domain-containing protein [Nitrospirae bacterium]|nr:EAL domain-containing protein [Nitrospirota bacterium]
MKIKVKITLLLAILISLFALGLFSISRSEKRRTEMLFADKLREVVSAYNALSTLKGESLENFVNDYSLWDDMVRYVSTGDRAWARVYLDTTLSMFKTDAIWVVNKGLKPVYSTEHSFGKARLAGPLPAGSLSALLNRDRFPHFFVMSGGLPMEVRGAPVQPSDDDDRVVPPKGWFFAGRVWDKKFLSSLVSHDNIGMEILSAGEGGPAESYDVGKGTVSARVALPGWDGVPVGYVMLTASPTALKEQSRLADGLFTSFVVFSLLVLLVLYGLLVYWVSRPLELINRSIESESPALISGIRLDTSEVGRLADLVAGFFRQREELIIEVDSRKHAERLLIEREKSLEHMAQHDALTGLPNRFLMRDRLEQAIALAKRSRQGLAVLLMDLDNFKAVNDTMGHPAGDALLKDLAGMLRATLRETDTVARLGGDEFCIILPGLADPLAASEVASKVIELCRVPIPLDGREVFVTASIGISVYPYGGADAESLLKNADIALYRAKEQGKNTFQAHTKAMSAYITERMELGSMLRQGLDRGEFELLYQPQTDVQTGAVVCMEALIRWRNPSNGYTLPSKFIPVAEESGLIVPLGEWALKAACAQNRLWREAGIPPVRVSVNLSARQFQDPMLPEVIENALRNNGLPPDSLELEITESTIVHNVEAAGFALARMKDHGIRIAIDDFGTGYSSLSYILKFSIHTLKVDRSFIMMVPEDHDSAAIVVAVAAMARCLGLNVVAEGVEREEQMEFLRYAGCPVAQGYLISLPLPAGEAAEYLRAHPPASC